MAEEEDQVESFPIQRQSWSWSWIVDRWMNIIRKIPQVARCRRSKQDILYDKMCYYRHDIPSSVPNPNVICFPFPFCKKASIRGQQQRNGMRLRRTQVKETRGQKEDELRRDFELEMEWSLVL